MATLIILCSVGYILFGAIIYRIIEVVLIKCDEHDDGLLPAISGGLWPFMIIALIVFGVGLIFYKLIAKIIKVYN